MRLNKADEELASVFNRRYGFNDRFSCMGLANFLWFSEIQITNNMDRVVADLNH